MILKKIPLISCVCVTKNRLDLLKKSIFCYINQGYSNKKLTILSQSSPYINLQIKKHIQELKRTDIEFFEAPENISLGEMRNISVELANGEIICQWDDDDLYHPDRIRTQFDALRKDKNNIASLYCDFLKYFAHTKEIYWCDWSEKQADFSHKFLCGSIMFYKYLFYEFSQFYPSTGPCSDKEEDLNVLEKICKKGKIEPILNGNHYIYVYHGKNTYNLDHHKLAIEALANKKILTNKELFDKRSKIEETIKLTQIKEKILVKSLEGIAFELNSDEI